jgi:undecaprenyl-diphosphatase
MGLFFRKKLFVLARNPLRCYKNILNALLYGICALMPTLFFYLLFEYLQPTFPLWLGFFITSYVLVATAYFSPPLALCDSRRESYRRAFLIGSAQGIALLPGISRLGITYAVGRWLGLSWRTSFAFSCMIEAPLIFLATCKGIYALREDVLQVTALPLIGYVGAAGVSYVILCLVYKLAQKNMWWIFGMYTSVLALLSFIGY